MNWRYGLTSIGFGDMCRLFLAGMLLLFFPVAFSVSSFTRIRQRMIRLSKWGAGVVPGTPSCTRVVSAVEIADYHLPGDRKCLTRSSTAEVLLFMYGFTPEHRIGVSKKDHDVIAAHSWIELNNDIILGELDDLERFNLLPPLSVDRAE